MEELTALACSAAAAWHLRTSAAASAPCFRLPSSSSCMASFSRSRLCSRGTSKQCIISIVHLLESCCFRQLHMRTPQERVQPPPTGTWCRVAPQSSLFELV